MNQEEQVLVIERKVLERAGIFNGLMFDVDRYLREIFVQGVPCFMNRSGELKVSGTFFDELCLIINSYIGELKMSGTFFAELCLKMNSYIVLRIAYRVKDKEQAW